MKTFLKLTVIAAGFAAAIPFATAQDATATAPTPATSATPAAKHPRLRAMLKHRAELRAKIAKKLNLTADQKTQLKAQRQQTAQALKAIRADASLTPDQKRAKAHDTLVAARTQMRSVLTPDQQAKLDQIRTRIRKHAGRA